MQHATYLQLGECFFLEAQGSQGVKLEEAVALFILLFADAADLRVA